jgi:exopolyphosphatase/pppGpp-phosphohydrolase
MNEYQEHLSKIRESTSEKLKEMGLSENGYLEKTIDGKKGTIQISGVIKGHEINIKSKYGHRTGTMDGYEMTEEECRKFFDKYMDIPRITHPETLEKATISGQREKILEDIGL